MLLKLHHRRLSACFVVRNGHINFVPTGLIRVQIRGHGQRLLILLRTRVAVAETPPHDTKNVRHLFNAGFAMELERPETLRQLTMRELASHVR